MFENYNPPTVVVVLIPWSHGLIAIQRADNSKWALPGGFQEKGETWQQAAAREVFEETGLTIHTGELRLDDIITVEGGMINLLFCKTSDYRYGELPEIADNVEALDMQLIYDGDDLSFPTHRDAAERHFKVDARAYYQ